MSPSAPESWPRYRLYGITMASDFPFGNTLARACGPCDLSFTRRHTIPRGIDLDTSAPVYTSPPRTPSDEPIFCVYQHEDRELGEGVVMCFTESADYYLYPDRIVCHLREPAYDYLVEIQFLGYVLSVWLESAGIPALHAAAVVVDGRALAFLASNKGGKSSLAASFMRAGFPLLTDDILPLERSAHGIMARPGYPQMRLWPEQAEHFLGEGRDFGVVHPAFAKLRIPVGPLGLGTHRDRSTPLGGVCVPEIRADGKVGVDLEPLPVREVFPDLLRHSFAGSVVEALRWQDKRLGTLAETASTVPAWRLRYPRGLDRLPEVRQEILKMLHSSQPKALV